MSTICKVEIPSISPFCSRTLQSFMLSVHYNSMTLSARNVLLALCMTFCRRTLFVCCRHREIYNNQADAVVPKYVHMFGRGMRCIQRVWILSELISLCARPAINRGKWSLWNNLRNALHTHSHCTKHIYTGATYLKGHPSTSFPFPTLWRVWDWILGANCCLISHYNFADAVAVMSSAFRNVSVCPCTWNSRRTYRQILINQVDWLWGFTKLYLQCVIVRCFVRFIAHQLVCIGGAMTRQG
jgi:hypothetical protein